jgi:hypothetical protein
VEHLLAFPPLNTLPLAADLVLLNGDPLSNIRNTRLMEGVIVHGEWLDRAALDGLLARTVGQA